MSDNSWKPWAEMTPEQLEYYMREVRPLVVAAQERSLELARRHAYELIRWPLRRELEQEGPWQP